MKSTLSISINTDLLTHAREKNCPFSLVCNNAIQKWLDENITVAESEQQNKKAQITEREAKIIQEANIIKRDLLKSPFLTKNWREFCLKNRLFTDEELDKILQLANNRLPEGEPQAADLTIVP